MNLFIRNFFEFVESLIGYFIIFKIRKIKISTELSKFPQYLNSGKGVALILQGPILERNDFTLETVKLYRHLYPNLNIIISTWIGVDPKLISQFEKNNVVVLQSEKPKFGGFSNINLQIKSTVAALNFSKELGATYVLKSRTDQRINSSFDYLGYMKNIMHSNPVDSKFLKSRLVVCNLNMYEGRKYILSDMFMFGNVDDMHLYWDQPTQQVVAAYDYSRTFLENNLSEAYFVNSFMNRVHFKPSFKPENVLQFFDDFFYVVDKNVIDIFWYKYNHVLERQTMVIENKIDRVYSTLNFFPSEQINEH